MINNLKQADIRFRYNLINHVRYGVMIDNHSVEGNPDELVKITFLFSVPSSSDIKDENGYELAGENLAKLFAENSRNLYIDSTLETFPEMSRSNIEYLVDKIYSFRYKIRDEHWNRNKEEKATAAAFVAITTTKTEYNV
jgi:hypothetical protein